MRNYCFPHPCLRMATAAQKHTAHAQSCTTSPKTHEGVATQPSTQHHVTQKQRKLTVANARHRRQLLVGCNHVSPRLTGASRWYEPKRSRFWAKCQLKPCMRTLFPRHWDPTPRCTPRRAIGLARRRVCHVVLSFLLGVPGDAFLLEPPPLAWAERGGCPFGLAELVRL